MQDLKCFYVSNFGMYECGQSPALSIEIHPIIHIEGPFGPQAGNSLVQQMTHSPALGEQRWAPTNPFLDLLSWFQHIQR